MLRRNFLRTLAGTTAVSASAFSAAGQSATAGEAGRGRPSRGTQVPRATTMYAMPSVEELGTLNADVAFLGVPYDLGHASKPGTRLGPAAIREGSREVAGGLTANDAGFYDRETGATMLEGIRVVDAGNVVIPSASIEQSLDNVTTAVATIVDRKAMPVVIGGDHSITFSVLRGFKNAGRKIHIVHFDAHQDFGPVAESDGRQIFNHGNHLRHAIELPWISGITMLGLRGLARGNGGNGTDLRRRGYELVSSSDIVRGGAAAAVARIPMADSYYVTLDIDVLDPSVAPATGTPVPGGLSYYQLCDVLAAVAARGRLIGFDIMEVSPPYDVQNGTAAVAAYVALRFLGAVFAHQRPPARA
jgi:agmatinase